MKSVVLELQRGTIPGDTPFYSLRMGRIKNVTKRFAKDGVIPPEYYTAEVPELFPFVPFRTERKHDGTIVVHPTPEEMMTAYRAIHEAVTLAIAADDAAAMPKRRKTG